MAEVIPIHGDNKAKKLKSFHERTRAFLEGLPSSLDPIDCFLLSVAFSFAQSDGSGIFASVETFSWLTHIPKRTAERRLDRLAEIGFLPKRELRPIPGKKLHTRLRSINFRALDEATKREAGALTAAPKPGSSDDRGSGINPPPLWRIENPINPPNRPDQSATWVADKPRVLNREKKIEPKAALTRGTDLAIGRDHDVSRARSIGSPAGQQEPPATTGTGKRWQEPLDESWVPSPFFRRIAEALGMDPDAEADEFRDYFLGKGHTVVGVGLWRKWLSDPDSFLG